MTEQPPQTDPFQKPEFPFFQQDFDGSQPEVSSDEKAYVDASFTRTVDYLLDNAPSDTVDHDGEEFYGEDTQGWSTFIDLPDGQKIEVNTTKDLAGKVKSRGLNLYWDDELIGKTSYIVFYGLNEQPTVRRFDDTGRIAPSRELPLNPDLQAAEQSRRLLEGYRDKYEAEADEELHSFNNQPVSKQEIDELQAYLRPTVTST